MLCLPFPVGSHAMPKRGAKFGKRSEEHTSELQSRLHLVCRLLLEKKKGPGDLGCLSNSNRARFAGFYGEWGLDRTATIDNLPHNVSHYYMPSVNIRQLRDTCDLKAWLRAGKTVELRERDHVIAHIVPGQEKDRPVKSPNFEARRKKIFGDRVLPGTDLLIEERGRY